MTGFEALLFVVILVGSVTVAAGFSDWARKRAEAGLDMKHVTQLNLVLTLGFAGLFLVGLLLQFAWPRVFPVSWTMLVCGAVSAGALGANHVALIKTYRLAREKAPLDRNL